MHEKRQFIRTEFNGNVKLMHERFGELEVEMRDLSDGGIFLFVAQDLGVAIGENVMLQSLDIEEAPVLTAEVVRIEANGIALKFV